MQHFSALFIGRAKIFIARHVTPPVMIARPHHIERLTTLTATALKAIALAVVAGICGLSAPAAAQDAQWVTRTLTVSGRDEAGACASARARAADAARAYQGLNIQQCQCRPVDDAGGQSAGGVNCRLTYEVLARQSSK
ncbi:MAG TPA: hypothetical protein VGA34_03645 [Alteraurantiacibacter sp.]